MKCVFTNKPTTRNFRGIPLHFDVLVAARAVRDKQGLTLRKIFYDWKKYKMDILKEMAKANDEYVPQAYPHTAIKTNKIESGKLVDAKGKPMQNNRFIAGQSPLLDK